jgi:hypothetical protein
MGHTYTKKKYVVYLKVKLNWASDKPACQGWPGGFAGSTKALDKGF